MTISPGPGWARGNRHSTWLDSSLARFLSGGGLDLPLILDDPFAHCDDPRTIKGMNVLLDSIAPDHQVILLACQRSRYDWLRQQLPAPDRIRMLALEDRV